MQCARGATLRTLVLASLLLVIQPVVGHHAFSGFDEEEVREITGTIKEFQFTNPHVWIQILTTSAAGEEVEWSLEWGSPNQLGRRGIRPSTFPPGAEVTVRTHPMRNGAPAGAFIGALFPDGTVVGEWDP